MPLYTLCPIKLNIRKGLKQISWKQKMIRLAIVICYRVYYERILVFTEVQSDLKKVIMAKMDFLK